MLLIGIVLPVSGTLILDNTTTCNVSGNTLYVGGDGPGNYSKIQDAVNDSFEGDTVFVYDDSSPYYERVKIEKSINLIGENRDSTIIDANFIGRPIRIIANHVTICGFTLQNSGSIFRDDGGIVIGRLSTDSNQNIIVGNKIINNIHGIHLTHSSENIIYNNIITNNHQAGIFLHADSCGNNITGNIFEENEYGIDLIEGYENHIINNTFNNNVHGIRISDTANDVVKNIFINNEYGIYLRGCGITKIYKNSIEKNQCGLYLLCCGNNDIKMNNFIDNECHADWWTLAMTLMFRDRFMRNYWDDHPSILPKAISGLVWFTFEAINEWLALFGFDIFFKPRNATMNYYDWFPASEPYNIDDEIILHTNTCNSWRYSNSLFLRLFEQFPNAFPILRHLLRL
jgi:parallel beta-helix repeat protein